MGIFICPICKGKLEKMNNSFHCKKGHCYDLSSRGYLHLLPASHMHSKTPGDNKQMVAARRSFLSKRYYQAVSDCLNQRILEYCAQKKQILLNIADVGCGEGYYTSRLAEALMEKKVNSRVYGLDISKFAVDAAAKTASKSATLARLLEDKEPAVRYAVASLFSLPLKDHSCQVLVNMFAPVCMEEFRRVLKRGGILVFAVSSTKHLWELKEKVYDVPYENEKVDQKYPGFTFLDKRKVNQVISIPLQEDIDSLFAMTPYFYKSSVETLEKVSHLGTLKTQIDVDIITYRVD